MKKIDFKKDEISIQNIGNRRFWFGVISGFIFTITISLIFNKTRELIRCLTSLSEDLLIFESKELAFFNYFFASLSTVLGLSITIWVWMGTSVNKKKKHKLYKQQIRTNTQLFFWLVLFLIAQLGCLFLFFILGKVSNFYDEPVNLYEEHSILFILIPIVIFTQNWFLVRLLYRTGKWILFSLIISLITIFILNITTTVDQNILNETYYSKYKNSIKYTENIISKSEKKYGIKFNNKAIEAIKKRKTWSSTRQIWNIKHSFSEDKKVSIDTIILQKIIIHNLKASDRYRYNGDSRTLVNWQYALPTDILKQINYFRSESTETKELFKVLREEILLINKSKIILDDYKELGFYERTNQNLKLKVNIMLVEQLIKVKDSLVNLEKYSELTKMLPEIKKLP